MDKYIGDEVMVIFAHDEVRKQPMEAALRTAQAMFELDPFSFRPRVGISAGSFAVALVGTQSSQTATAMGNTVNLAARCVDSIPEDFDIRIAIDDLDLVNTVFGDAEGWEISSPIRFEPKNMLPVNVVDIKRNTIWFPNFDYVALIKQNVEIARSLGSIKQSQP